MIRTLIADDQPLARGGLAALLGAEDDIEVVGTAADGDQALDLALELRPDVACLDIRMPGLDGIEVAARISAPQLDDPIPVLILTTFDIDDYVFRALEVGVSGFLLKDSEPEEILSALRSVAEGYGTIDRKLTRRIVSEYTQRRQLQPVVASRALSVVTTREREILMLLAQGMTNSEIADQLVIEVATVKSHLARMLPKLGVRSRLQAVVWAYQNHLVTVQDA